MFSSDIIAIAEAFEVVMQKSHLFITKLVEYRYNSVEIDVQLCTQF